MTGQLFTHYFLTDGIKATRRVAGVGIVLRRLPAEPRPSLRDLPAAPSAQRGAHRAGPHPAGPRAPRLDRLPAPAGRRPQPGHPRPPPVHRRRIQDPRRRQVRSKGPLPARLSRRGEQTLRPTPRCPRQRRPGPGRSASGGRKASQHAPRPDPPLPLDRRYRVRRPDSLGHSD